MDRITSRKFLITVLSAALFILQGHYPEAVTVILGYFGANVFEQK